MKTILVSVLMSDPALTIYSIIALICLGYAVRKWPWIKKYTDIATDIFAYIENNYKSWGIKGNEKLDYFIKDFIARYSAQFGKIPTQDIIENAVKLVESLVAAQNKAVKEAA